MRSILIHYVNLLLAVLPSTRLFALKRRLWRAGGAEVGNGVSLNLGSRIFGTGSLSIGADTWVGIGATFIVPQGSGVCVGANCDIAPGVLFQCGSHLIGGPERRAGEGFAAPISVGDGTWIGARVVMLGGAHVGAGCVVAAGAVVIAGTYPAQSLLAGVPARIVRQLDGATKMGSR
ncbi:MAG: hypothetical protein RLZZ444_2671 [Pseudomonadota bacterium]